MTFDMAVMNNSAQYKKLLQINFNYKVIQKFSSGLKFV